MNQSKKEQRRIIARAYLDGRITRRQAKSYLRGING